MSLTNWWYTPCAPLDMPSPSLTHGVGQIQSRGPQHRSLYSDPYTRKNMTISHTGCMPTCARRWCKGYDERWGTRPWTLPFLRPRIPWKLATDLKQLRKNWWLCSVMIFRWCYSLPISWLAPQRIGGKLIAMLMKKLPPSLEMSFNVGKLSCSLCSAGSHLYRASNYNFRNRQMGNQKQDN
jgi:hypothetical protein